jgi:hypothetical protein
MIRSAVKNTDYGKAFGTSIIYMLIIMISLILDLSFGSANALIGSF